ncbi:bleomycin hydrolase-like isoform X2 [Mercenaria mercenaria]|uniref:bleomycin hydrolase-like isoform X2 n=1 Tax=Mercenaria mercenaria TaxID=6596 RepID=UPI00234EE609|nr:bleomycin hydrolase-like isoform X2 [Mercenaria mercenaria]
MSKTTPGISQEWIEKYQKNFESSEKNLLAQNVCVQHSLVEMCSSRARKQTTQHCFSHKVEKEGSPMTNQKGSGRCWIFACNNIMRIPFMKKFNLEEFEFSQTYLFFWDKVERANYLLDAFVECARNGETYEGRLISHLLHNPSEDGGQWDMLTNLVEKYGVIPKVCYPESWSAENSRKIGELLNNRLRENCMCLHRMVSAGKTDVEINKEKMNMMEEIYRMMCIVLGTPPTNFTFQYYSKGENDKSPKFNSLGPLSPQDFYSKHIKPDCLDMEDLVCLVNDPRPQNPYNKLYTVQYLGNMTGGKRVLYINKPVDVLKQLAIKSIVDNKSAVWFGCDVGKSFRGNDGYLDLKGIDYKLVLGIDTHKMNKAERLMYGESLMTHAMVFTGVNLQNVEKTDETPKADKWRVENSWGNDRGDKGYLVMTDDWFSEYVYEVVISKKLLDAETLAILEQEPVVLPAWDPMGALAH